MRERSRDAYICASPATFLHSRVHPFQLAWLISPSTREMGLITGNDATTARTSRDGGERGYAEKSLRDVNQHD
jgi:hypothetical protein